ncbi:MAG TPA: proline dehydrogenase family protein [Actinomycetota bacterium]|nr:proline dehydrogenase family protein [Actinomycetota bacterium]
MSGAPLRAPVLWLTDLPWVRSFITEGQLGRRVARRFVAGETLDEGLDAARRLGRSGIRAMLDHLGENVTSPAQASAAADGYALALKRIHDSPGLDCTISIKLTQLGLDLSLDLCLENTERVLAAAAPSDTLVMIDMESHRYVDPTLDAVRRLRERHDRVGVALQSYLFRSPADVFGLPERVPVRLVKGAYLEPASVAYGRRDEVDRAFARLFATLVGRGHPVHVATHDPRLLAGACRLVERRGIDWDRVELQMLYGIRRDLQDGYARRGYPVRAYIPYGEAWYPYLTRRLAERPANLWFFASNLMRRR